MAKRFGGFTPQQQQTLLSKMGYTGPAQQDDINKFMMSSPKAASMMGKYAQMAKARVEGGPQMAMHVGGDVPLEIKPGQSLADAAVSQQAAADQMADTQDPQIAASNTAQAEAIKETVRPQPRVNPGVAQPQPLVQRPLVGTQGTTDPQSRAYIDAYNQRMQEQMELFNQGQLQPLVQRPMPTPQVNPGIAQPQMRVRQNPQTGSFEVVNEQGKVVRSNLDNQQQAMQYVMEQTPRPMRQPYVNPGFVQERPIQATYAGPSPRPQQPQQYYNPTEAEQGYLQNIGNYNQAQQQAINAYMQHQNLMASPMAKTAMIQPLNPAYREELYNIGMLERPEPKPQSNPFIAGTFNPSMFSENRLQGFAEGGTVYDPATGLPTAPEAIEGKQEEYTKGISNWAGGLKDMITSGTIPEDLTDYTVDKQAKTVTFKDGTTIPLTMKKFDDEGPRLQEAINKVAEYRDTVLNPYQQQKSIYDQQVEQYNQYTTGAAQTQAAAPTSETIKAAQDAANVSQNLIATYNKQLSVLATDDPRRADYEKRIADEQVKLNQANAELTTAKQQQTSQQQQQAKERIGEFEAAPAGQVTKADVATVSEADRAAGMVADTTGQAGEVTTAATRDVTRADEVTLPEVKEAATYTAEQTAAAVQDTLDKLTAVTGKPSADALAEAQTMSPDQLAQLGLTAAQIEQAVQVQAPQQRTLQEGELVEGPTVDMARLESEALNFEAATGTPSTEATVQGQLTNLMEQFEGGETPAWAAGAIRAATQRMAARGLSASSMAGQAIVQAAMESAMPIAMTDAATVARFEETNLSNRQQAAILKAEQRAKFLGMEFDQAFQTRVANAAKISDIANQNFSAEVQISLENARLAQSVDLANLNAKNAKMLSDAAAMSNLELTNLNNRQQAAVQQANAFLDFDMKNLDRQQQVAMFKSQGVIQSILSDAAATNAAAQFNATSENQTNQFYDSLISQVQQFNVDQANAMERFETEQANTMARFNAEQAARREEFNATNALIVAQANAKWDQEISLTETAATNAANRDAAQAANNMTTTAYEAQKQADRDSMSYAFQTANNNADRATSIAVETMRTDASASAASASKSAAFATAAGTVIANIVAG